MDNSLLFVSNLNRFIKDGHNKQGLCTFLQKSHQNQKQYLNNLVALIIQITYKTIGSGKNPNRRFCQPKRAEFRPFLVVQF